MAEFSPELLTAWLDEKGFEFKCLVCSSEEYATSENLIRISSPGPGLRWGQPFQGAYIYCTVCGYTMFFNAGIFPFEA